jgi:hypothetical protein
VDYMGGMDVKATVWGRRSGERVACMKHEALLLVLSVSLMLEIILDGRLFYNRQPIN